MTEAERAVREAHTTCFNCVGEVGLRDESEFNVDCHAHHAAIDHAIEAVKKERDALWTTALCNLGDSGQTVRVTDEFNRLCARIGKEGE